jgi:hypothetical protein
MVSNRTPVYRPFTTGHRQDCSQRTDQYRVPTSFPLSVCLSVRLLVAAVQQRERPELRTQAPLLPPYVVLGLSASWIYFAGGAVRTVAKLQAVMAFAAVDGPICNASNVVVGLRESAFSNIDYRMHLHRFWRCKV